MIILTEVKLSHCPSFHCYRTIPYVAVKRTCYFRDFYDRNNVIFTQHIFIRLSAWIWAKIFYYGRHKFLV